MQKRECEHNFQLEYDDMPAYTPPCPHEQPKPSKRKWRCTKCLEVRRTED